MSPSAFLAWAETFDWAAQRFLRHHLRVCATYVAPDGNDATVEVPITHTLNESLSGGKLHELVHDQAFLSRLNVDICSSLGPSAVEALASLSSLKLTYGPSIVLADLLAIGGDLVRDRFRNRRVRRKDLTLFVSFFHDYQPVQIQRSRPVVPEHLLFENLLGELRHCDEFLASVIALIRSVATDDHLDSALRAIQELQIAVVAGPTIDILSDEDQAAIEHILRLAQPQPAQAAETIT
jgi:hypothetical protein